MFAVIQTGGKQYIVTAGQKLKVELLSQEVGSDIAFDPLLLSDIEGNDVKVGQPTVVGSIVQAKIVEHGRADKVSVVKFKRKVRYRRNVGHRQPFTMIEIVSIT